MHSPIAQMQRAWYPREPHPLAHLRAMRMGAFGDLTQGITGVKAGVSAGTTATALGAGVASAIGAGAAAGSVVPIIGTAIGVIVALVASGVFNHRMDPEVGNFNNAIAMVRAQGPSAVLSIQDKYLVLAGLFDLEPNQIKGNIPIYKKYGRMGEQHFVMDLCSLIQHAADQGIITANDTVQSVYDKVVAPWIAGFGYGPMQDANGEMITMLILGLIGEYVSGQFKTRWYAVGGDFPFVNLPLFKLPVASAVMPTPSGTPMPTTAPPTPSAPAPAPPAPIPPGFTWVGTSQYGQAIYRHDADGALVTFNSAGVASAYTAGTQPTPVQQSAVPVPAGFAFVGYSNNLPAYQGPDGYYYSWSGTTMSPLTGLLTGNQGQVLSVQGGSAVNPNTGPILTSPPPSSSPLPLLTNTQAGLSPAPYAASPNTPYTPYTPPSAPVPAISAGVDTRALPSWVSIGAVAAVAGLMLMSARRAPASRGYRPRAPR